jgi:hypothetical protein
VFLFEFMDQPGLPASLHATLREVLGFHLRVTLGYYYRWAAAAALERAVAEGVTTVAELGAGAAGFSETLASMVRDRGTPLRIAISDMRPDPARYEALERAYPGVVEARSQAVDFIAGPHPPEPVILVLSAAFHHVPPHARAPVLAALATRKVLVFESVTKTLPSMFGCAIGWLPALLTPLYFWRTPVGRWRRVVWCWLIPVAPFMVAWDGVVSCLRCWTEDEWRTALRQVGVRGDAIAIRRRGFSHMIRW